MLQPKRLRRTARLTEPAEDVVGSGAKKVLTKNGASCVALVHESGRSRTSWLACAPPRPSWVEQDAVSAPARFKKLQAELVKARALLGFERQLGYRLSGVP